MNSCLIRLLVGRYSRNETFWNTWRRLPDHSALMPANLITFPHFSVSAAMKFVNSAGELANTRDPKSEIRPLIFGSASAALISLLRLSTDSAGVAFGVP